MPLIYHQRYYDMQAPSVATAWDQQQPYYIQVQGFAWNLKNEILGQMT